MMTKSLNETLGEDSVSILRNVLGEKLVMVYGSFFEIEDRVVTSSVFSFRISRGWINIDSEWKETPNDLSYYKISVELSDKPRNLAYLPEERRFTAPVSSLTFNKSDEQSEIVKIEIYSKAEHWGEEHLVYDHAIVFVAANGIRLCFSVKESITDETECSIDAPSIDVIIGPCDLRHELVIRNNQ